MAQYCFSHNESPNNLLNKYTSLAKIANHKNFSYVTIKISYSGDTIFPLKKRKCSWKKRKSPV